MDIHYFLLDTKCANRIISYVRNGPVKTRSSTQTITSSCRLWQTIFMIMDVFQIRYPIFSRLLSFCGDSTSTQMEPDLYKIIYLMHRVYHKITTDSTSRLFHLVAMNNPTALPIIPIMTIKSIYAQVGKLYPMCIYLDPRRYPDVYESHMGGVGMINHYFTIFFDGENYWLNSSYGSDYVCIPQKTFQLVPELFDLFCVAIAKTPSDRTKIDQDAIHSFFTLYFLQGGMRKRVDEDSVEADPTRWSEWIIPESGRESEIKVYTNNKYGFSVGWIETYQTELHAIMTSSDTFKGLKQKKYSRRKILCSSAKK